MASMQEVHRLQLLYREVDLAEAALDNARLRVRVAQLEMQLASKEAPPAEREEAPDEAPDNDPSPSDEGEAAPAARRANNAFSAEREREIADYLLQFPDESYANLRDALGVSTGTIARFRQRLGLKMYGKGGRARAEAPAPLPTLADSIPDFSYRVQSGLVEMLGEGGE